MDDDALDRYATQRKEVAVASIQAYTDRNYRDLAAADDVARQQRDATLRADAADPARARAYLLKAAMLADRI